MSAEDLRAMEELGLVCRNQDILRIRELFGKTSLNNKDTTCYLRYALPDHPALMRCLLEQGANANTAFFSEDLRNLETLKLLTEYEFDIGSRSHLFLQ
jgi:hypothetical protein